MPRVLVKRLSILLAIIATAALAGAAMLTSGCGTSGAAAQSSAVSNPPAWLLQDMTRWARICGDAHASAWWTLTTAGRAAVVEEGEIDELSRNTDRPVFAYVMHGAFTRSAWSSSPSGAQESKYGWVVVVVDANSHIVDVAGHGAKPFDTSGLAMQPVVLGATPSPQSTTSASNVSGNVLLQQVDGVRPGSGLSVTARSMQPSSRLATVQTLTDGSFQLSLEPGWYVLTVDYWGEPALQIHVSKIGVTYAPITAPAEELGKSTRVVVNDPPAVIPAPGLWLGSQNVLLEPPRAGGHVISRAKALKAALGGAKSARMLLATVSDPQRILAPHGPMANWLTWVVVRDLPRPIDYVIGGYVPKGTPRTPGLATHSVSLIDARTGKFLLGFFTK